MADIELVIKIPKETYDFLKRYGTDGGIIEKAVLNGTPLPKGHWINADEKVTAQLYDDQYEIFTEKEMTIAEWLDCYTEEGCPMSIIEADTESEDKNE